VAKANLAETTLRRTLAVAIRYTIVTTILLGLGYPLLVTGLAQMLMRHKANGQMIVRNGQVIGSAIIAQGFTSDRYFHARPSAAGNGYDATSSGGSNLAPSNQALMTRIDAAVAEWQRRGICPKARCVRWLKAILRVVSAESWASRG
jgi:K+-transporting ATPase ATPase C chain